MENQEKKIIVNDQTQNQGESAMETMCANCCENGNCNPNEKGESAMENQEQKTVESVENAVVSVQRTIDSFKSSHKKSAKNFLVDTLKGQTKTLNELAHEYATQTGKEDIKKVKLQLSVALHMLEKDGCPIVRPARATYKIE